MLQKLDVKFYQIVLIKKIHMQSKFGIKYSDQNKTFEN